MCNKALSNRIESVWGNDMVTDVAVKLEHVLTSLVQFGVELIVT